MKNYQHTIKKSSSIYYMTITVVEWLTIFQDASILQIIVDALNYAIQEKKLIVYGYCIMPNHLHIIANTEDPIFLKDVMRNFKRFTSRKITAAFIEKSDDWSQYCISYFKVCGKFHRKNIEYKVWKDGNHAIELYSSKFYHQKLNYIHQNPVRARLVERPEEWVYSSAIDYLGGKSVLVRVVPLPGISNPG